MKDFERSELNIGPVKTFLKEMMDEYGVTRAQAKAQYNRLKDDEIWCNDQYQVNIARNTENGIGLDMHHLSIKRLDKDSCHDWRHFQEIKNKLFGENFEAIEIYPSEERLIDGANQYHLWVFPEGYIIPVGFFARGVCYTDPVGGRQRPESNDS